MHRREHEPVWFGPALAAPPRNRFDAPGGEYRVCYLGATLGVSILETLVRGRRRPIIARDELEARSASWIALAEPLHLLQLEGKALHAFGVDVSAVSSADQAACRDLALRIWTKHPDIDGIQYRSRFDRSTLCFAIFDRVADRLSVSSAPRWLGDARTVVPALRPYSHISVI